MPNLNAALGCAQIENLNFFLKRSEKLQKDMRNFLKIVSMYLLRNQNMEHQTFG